MDPRDQRAAQVAGAAQNRVQMKVTPEMIKNSKSITCECGGMLFQEKIFFKVLSALISPSGKEELVPMPVFVCENCGKVPGVFDVQNILPEEVKARAPFVGSKITEEMVEKKMEQFRPRRPTNEVKPEEIGEKLWKPNTVEEPVISKPMIECDEK